jgi:dTMP kinase
MQKNPYLGTFIVFEGLDGSGQTTQANLLKDFLSSQGYKVVLTKEPTENSEAGKKIRAALDQKISFPHKTLQELFAQDRREHLENSIIPALKTGKCVISDRYFFSSFAYGTASGIDLNWLIQLNDEFLMPDFTIILKVRPEICIERIEKRGEGKTLFEKIDRLQKVWEIYEKLPSRFENVFIIDGEKTVEEVFQTVKEIVRSKLNMAKKKGENDEIC